MANLDRIIVSDEDNIRLDLYLADYYEDISRSKLSKLIKEDHIKVNGKSTKASYLVSEGDVIDLDLKPLDLLPLQAEDLPLDIVYQDEDIAIVNKPMGIISHPTNTIRSGTLVNFLLGKFDNLPSLNGLDRPGIVHRLDMDTSGLMIVALNDESMTKLIEMFKNQEVVKKYRAIVNGSFTENKEVIEKNIGRSEQNRKLMAVRPDGKYAKTSISLLETNGEYSLLDINLHTGRTHQIRVHLASISRPILGDKDYNKQKSKFNIQGQLLQAYYLEFDHPISGERLKFSIEAYPEFNKYYNIIFKG